MQYKLIIEGRLSGLNDYQYKCRSHWSKGNELKRHEIGVVSAYILTQLRNVHINKKVRVHYTWYEKDRMRDLDNISSFGRKVIQDALVEMKVLEDDGWKHVVGFTDNFEVDKQNPRIEVVIEEIED
jgi:Holliday junction resolvase RusA-like endonuclease